jgi:CheY-like chemotaxis protein
MNMEQPAPATGDRKPPVLIVEDHRISQKIFSLIVEKMGYAVTLADNGPDGIARAASDPPALVFMDMQMPRMGGYEAAAALRKQGFKRPIIAISGGGERPGAGIDDVLPKPFRRDQIERMILKWAGAAPAAIPGPAAPPEKEIFNLGELLETFLDNMDTVKSVLRRFLERTERQIMAIPGLAEQGDWENARREAHTIKGSSYTLGGKELGKAAALLEQACKDAGLAEARAALAPVKEAFGRFKAAAEKFLAES